MLRKILFLFPALILWGAAWLPATPNFIPSPSAYHVYIDAKLILMLELTPQKEIFVEVLNLGDARRCLNIENLVVRTEKSEILKFDSFLYDGSVSKSDGGDRACITPRQRRKWELGYSFPFPERVKKVYFLLGDQMYRLEPLSDSEYQQFRANCEKINLGVSSEYLKVFNLKVLFGKNIYGSVLRYRKVPISRTADGTRGPVTLLSTSPPQTEMAFKKKKGGEVSMKIKLDGLGDVTEAVTENQLEYGLTERAVYEVKNWWEFAPAFENGKPISSGHTVKLIYRVEEEEED
jgi:hypothetical protein